MTANPSGLEPAFVEKQRQYLTRLRAALQAAASADEADEADLKAAASGSSHEYEEDAQKLDALELDGNLVVRDVERLTRVDRALEKIAQGTYGLSDVSGQPIPRERLEAAPESVTTVAEQQAREKKR